MADFQVQWTDTARLDLERIIEFIAEENPANALTVLARLERRCQTLTSPHCRNAAASFPR